MKKLLFYIAVLIITTSGAIFPQGGGMGFDSKFAFGGGFTPGWFFPNFDGLNERLNDIGIGELSKSGFFATGGTGYVSLPMFKNFRIGGMGMGGSTTEKATVNGFNREAEYSVSLGGFTVEYTLPFVPSVALSAGAIIGGGNVTVELYQNRGSVDWDDIWDEYDTNTPSQNLHRKLSNTFFTIAPTLNVDIPINRFLAFRIGGGYQIALGGKWKFDNGEAINNVPDAVKKNSVFIQTGIFIGYFNY